MKINITEDRNFMLAVTEKDEYYRKNLYGKPLDKAAADEALKKYKKEILDVFFAENGFSKWKSASYIRLKAWGLAEMVELQKFRFTGDTFCVNYGVCPLYVPDLRYCSCCVGCSIGDRLGCQIRPGGGAWVYRTDETAKISFENVRDMVRLFLLPAFDEFCVEENYLNQLMADKGKKGVGYRNDLWVKALEVEDRRAVILENIERLKLPRRIIKGEFSG